MDVQNLFLKQHGSFAKNLQFETIVVFSVVIVILTQSFEKTYGFVILLLVFAFYIANSYVIVKNDKINDFNSVTMVKLQTLQSKVYDTITKKISLVNNTTQNQPAMSQKDINNIYKQNELDALYIDANLIHFLFSIVKLHDYNPDLFFTLLKGTNNILRIRKEIDTFFESNGEYPENTSEMLDIALQLRSNAINNLHDFIYTVPKTSKMYSYIGDSVERYATLISRVTDSIHASYKNNIKQRGINATTKFVTYNTTKPFDYSKEHSIIPGDQQSNAIIPFYI
jgi:hypothetical protein